MKRIPILSEWPERWVGEEKYSARQKAHRMLHTLPPSPRGRASGLLNSRNEINAKDDGKYRKIFCGT